MSRAGEPTDSKSSEIVVGDREDGSLPHERHKVGSNATHHRNEDDEGAVKPVDMLIPVL